MSPLPGIDPNSLTPLQAEAYAEIQTWRGTVRLDRAADLLDYIGRMRAGTQVSKRMLIRAIRLLTPTNFAGSMRDARTLATMATGIAPQVAIPHLGNGMYGPPTEGDLLAWVRTRARSLDSQTATVANVVSAFADTHPAASQDVDTALSEAERLHRASGRFGRRVGA